MNDNFNIKDIFLWLDFAGIKYKNTTEQKNLGIDILNEEYKELVKGILSQDKEQILDGACDLIWVITNNIIFNGISFDDFKKYFEKTSQSNWSKFCSTEKEAMDTVTAYGNGTHPDKLGQIISAYYYQVSDNRWGVFRNDGKILKSINYQPVNTLYED